MSVVKIDFKIKAQPDDSTCGPTCLSSVYRYYNDFLDINKIVNEIGELKDGGTLATFLGKHALNRGYRATIYTYNIQVFDPTWFSEDIDLIKKLEEQIKLKKNRKKICLASQAAIEFLKLGGKIKFAELTPSLLRKYLKRGIPIITGLSATYLYGSKRENPKNTDYDDVGGYPSGHFVVLDGYNKETKKVFVADPLKNNKAFDNQNYEVEISRVLSAILLGVLTHDANLLIIEKK